MRLFIYAGARKARLPTAKFSGAACPVSQIENVGRIYFHAKILS